MVEKSGVGQSETSLEQRIAELEKQVEMLTTALIGHSHSAIGGRPFAAPWGPLWKLRESDDA